MHIMTQTDPNNVEQKTGYSVEELQVVGEQLLARVKEVVHEGNVRRIIIKQDGRTILEIPLTIGVAGVIVAPIAAAIGVLGALIAQCSIEVIRSETPTEVVKEKVEEIKDSTLY
jgi:phage-related minor tail protein